MKAAKFVGARWIDVSMDGWMDGLMGMYSLLEHE